VKALTTREPGRFALVGRCGPCGVREAKIRTLGGDVPPIVHKAVEAVDQLDNHRIFRELRFRTRVNRSYLLRPRRCRSVADWIRPSHASRGCGRVPTRPLPARLVPYSSSRDRTDEFPFRQSHPRAGLEVSRKPCNHVGDAVPAATRPSSNWGNENSLYRPRLGG